MKRYPQTADDFAVLAIAAAAFLGYLAGVFA